MSIELYPSPASPSTPQAPSWAYTAGTIGAGKFKTNTGTLAGTNTITLSDTDATGGAQWTAFLLANIAALLMTGASGSSWFRVTAGSSSGGNAVLTVSLVCGGGATVGANWSGAYSIIPMPGIVELQAAAGITPVTSSAITPVTSVTPTQGFITAIS